jgi:hypothetical protein
MHPPTHTASPETIAVFFTVALFGAYHGLNPGMGWLFALALGLQQNNEKAIWTSLAPITLGHAFSIVLVAGGILALQAFISLHTLQAATGVLLIGFGVYKMLNWYRHPKWVGMKVRWHELTIWSFLMATAHGAGLMIAPVLLGLFNGQPADGTAAGTAGIDAGLGVLIHTMSMLVTMAAVAWIVYKKLGLMVLRKGWLNFDLIWAAALLVVGGLSLFSVLG